MRYLIDELHILICAKKIDVDFARPETELIEKIVDVIFKKLFRMPSPITWHKDLVGVDPHMEQVTCLLRIASPEVRSVGIWGMAGIGKTTIGEYLCSFMEAHFDGCYFFPCVREEVKKFGEEVYWSMALSKIFEEPINTSVPLTLRSSFVKQKLLRRRHIFLVFDDVDDSVFQEVEALADHHLLFGEGTKIVMTSRDKQVLKKFCVDEVYEVVELAYEDALKLFSLKAFKKESPPVSHIDSCELILGYAQGNPLALTVFGSSLLGKDKSYWDSALAKMEKFSTPKIMNLLRISYDGLSSKERSIFLDVALIFRMEEMDHAVELLESRYDHVTWSSMTNLIDKSLVCVDQYKRLWVHDLLHEMSLEINNEESTHNGSEKCSRLADPNEIKRVLLSRKGIGTVHAMYFNMSETKGMSFDLDAITEMENLRWLRLSGRNDEVCFFKPRGVFTFEWLKMFRRNYQVLPHLNYFGWQGCPLESLPSTFYIKNVVKLNFKFSQFQRLWTGAPEFPNLKWINMDQSEYLKETPDFSNAKNLEFIDLFYCTALVRLHPSIQYLPKLKTLWLECCYNLCQVPSRFESKVLKVLSLCGCTKIKECPTFASKLEELRLSMTDIKRVPNCTSLTFFKDDFLQKDVSFSTKLPDIPTSVIDLAVIRTDIEEVPSSIQFLSELEFLLLNDNQKLYTISGSISAMKSLSVLWIAHCNTLTSIPELPPTLQKLVIEFCGQLEIIAPMSNQSQLKDIRILDCSRLGDEGRRNITQYAFDKMQAGEVIKVCLPKARIEIPEWFTYQSVGSSLTLNFPSNHDHKSLIGVAFCFLVEPTSRNGFSRDCKPHEIDPEIDHDDHHLVRPVKVEIRLDDYKHPFLYDHMILFRFPLTIDSDYSASPSDVTDVRGSSHCKISFQCYTSKFDCVVKKCGARPIFDTEEPEPEELLVADYASSRWSLQELDKSLGCPKEHNKLIVPVFYNVRPSRENNHYGWLGYLLQSLPSTFYIKNVVRLNFTSCWFQRLWTGAPEFPNLKRINMQMSVPLKETPDFSNAKNLEWINLFYCIALVKLHPSIQHLPKLESLWLESCYNLCQVPSRFESKVLKVLSLYGCTKIKECPRLASKLEKLRLSVTDIKRVPNCSILIFYKDIFLEKDLFRTKLPDIPISVRDLKVLQTDIEEVPSSIQFLRELEFLLLNHNPKLISISGSISAMKSLYVLWIANCEILTSIPELPSTLQKLVIQNCASLETIAPMSNQSQLKDIRILDCSRLGDEGRRNITQYAFDKMQAWEVIEVCLPQARMEIPEWFTYQSVGSSLTLNFPSNHDHKSLIGVAFCLLVEPTSRNSLSLNRKPHEIYHEFDPEIYLDDHHLALPVKVEIDHDDHHLVLRVKVEICLNKNQQPFIYDHMILFCISLTIDSDYSASPSDVTDVRGSSHCKISFQCYTSKFDCVVKKCGARPIFDAEEAEPEELLVAD